MLSLVIPIYNESLVLETLFERVRSASSDWGMDFEVIMVDDGSRDDSLTIMAELNRRDPRFKGVSLSRNFGHQVAVTAGLQHVNGRVVAIMDADLQDPPEILAKFIDKWREGFDVIYAVRTNRKENAFIKAAFWGFYRIMSWLSEMQIPLDAGDFCVMDRKVVDILNDMPERNRFVRGLRAWAGFRQTGLTYDRPERLAGDVSFSLHHRIKFAFDGIISFSYKPLRFFGIFGLIVSVAGFLGIALFVVSKIFSISITPYTYGQIPGFFPIISAIVFLGGVQLIGLGLFGEYIGRIYDEVKKRPQYIVGKTIGIGEEHSTTLPTPISERNKRD
ncbi:MAG: glycosyltransferase family 2 protein [Magnetococcales bacterium]|nr:glycosyltransferase family 2 protein [Magnetococcales bacterium]